MEKFKLGLEEEQSPAPEQITLPTENEAAAEVTSAPVAIVEEPKKAAPKSKKNIQYRVCSLNPLQVRRHPTKEAEAFSAINHGTVVTALDNKNGWLRIRIREEMGWIPKNRTVEV